MWTTSNRTRLSGLVAVIAMAVGVHLAAQPAGTTIAVDFERVERVIPPLLFGQNLQTIERGDGVLREDGTFDEEIVQLLSDLRLTTLRYPGGTPADFLHWWQALGPHSSRPRQASGKVNDFYTPTVGPEEFITLSTALRAVPFVTANFGSGSPEEAAAFARFFATRGFPVTFWEVGNEVYFEGILDSGFVGPPPDFYARKLIAYAAAIRQEAPYAKIYAAAVIGPEEADSYWNSVVLGLAGAYIDGVSIHNAYYPLHGYLPDKTVPSDEYLFRAMLGATKAVDRTLGVLEDQLDRLGRLIPIFVTEYDGIFYPNEDVEPPSRTHERNPTLGAALFNASALQIFARHRRVHGAHHMALAGPHYGSLIGIDGSTRVRNPQYFVHHEYAREAGNLLVHSTLDAGADTFSSGPIQGLSGQTGVPMLDAMATRDASGEQYSLFVVNRNLSSATSAAISVNLPAGVTGTVSVLTGPTYSSRNTAAAPETVKLTTTPFTGVGSFTHAFGPHSLTIFRWRR